MGEENTDQTAAAATQNLPAPRKATEVLAHCEVGPRGTVLATFDHVVNYAAIVLQAGFAPKDMDTLPKCIIAVELGNSLGLHPLQAIQNIAVINGRPTLWGDAAKAVVMNTGEVEIFDETYEGEGDNYRAVCVIQRRGYKPVETYFSMADAKKAGLLEKSGPWKQYTRRMLQMRARAFCMRDAFPDALKGMHVREELEDAIDVVATEIPATNGPVAETLARYPGSKAAQRRATAVEPVVDETQTAPERDIKHNPTPPWEGPLEAEPEAAPTPTEGPKPEPEPEAAPAPKPAPKTTAEKPFHPEPERATAAKPGNTKSLF